MANFEQPRRAWVYCERGHLFYSDSSATKCHVCKAHGLDEREAASVAGACGDLPGNPSKADFIRWQRAAIVKTYPMLAKIQTRYRFDGMAHMPAVADFIATGIAQLTHVGEPIPIDLLEKPGQGAHEFVALRMVEALRPVTRPDFMTFHWSEVHEEREREKRVEMILSDIAAERVRQPAPMPTIGTTIERVPGVIVTPPPAQQPIELHDGHCAARRKWRKALADMLREERASRTGQTTFRAAVLANYGGRCAITGTALDVEAAHIEPWRENGNQEPDNGIPMVWALHKCYDRFPAMFAIHPDTLRIHVRPGVVGLEGYEGRQIADGQNTSLNRDALRARWAAFMATASAL